MIEFTKEARDRILAFIEEDAGGDLSVRVSVRNPSPVAPEYEMALIEPWEKEPGDRSYEVDGLEVVVDCDSAEILQGTTVDWVESLEGSGFRFANPNLEPLGAEPLTGTLAERVQQVLERRINPGVAMHGGAVTLVDVRDGTVYLQMGGGCQGCGMASVTLTQGIRQILTEEVPEIEEIVDVTDHASGENPYFQPGK